MDINHTNCMRLFNSMATSLLGDLLMQSAIKMYKNNYLICVPIYIVLRYVEINYKR